MPAPFLLRSDNGLIFTRCSFTALVRGYGLHQEFITPYCLQQNGMIERVIRTLKEQCMHLHRFAPILMKTSAKGLGPRKKKARADYKSQLIRKLRSQHKKDKMPAEKINAAAERDAAATMKNLAALHEPDMIAGGGDVVHGLGDKSVNFSIGSQWESRVDALDTTAKKIGESDQANTMMNAKLPECK